MRIVFVHLGAYNADHLWANINYLNRNMPNKKITVIINNKIFLNKIKKLNCEVWWYQPDELATRYLDKLEIDKNFRDGFWRFAIERFVALNQWHGKHSKLKMLHVESDNLLLSNFPWNQMSKINNLAWLRHNNDMDSAAIVYSPSPLNTKWLLNKILIEIHKNSNTNDMYILNRISKQNLNKVYLLPSYNPKWIEKKSRKDLNDLIKQRYPFEKGIFDPAALGVWLTGSDPRNSMGWIKRYKNHFNPSMDPSNLNYNFSEKRLTCIYKGVEEEVFNLHIHSKQKIIFSRLNEILLKIYVVTSHKRLLSALYDFNSIPKIFIEFRRKKKITLFLLIKNFAKILKSRKSELF